MEGRFHDFQVLHTGMAIPLGTQHYMIREAIDVGGATYLNVDTYDSGHSLSQVCLQK